MKGFVLSGLLFLMGCQLSPAGQKTEVLGTQIVLPFLIDTFTNPLDFDTAFTMTESAYFPMYIGKETDTVYASYWTAENTYETFIWDQYRLPDSNELILAIDTHKLIGSVQNVYFPPPPPGLVDYIEPEKIKKRGPWKSYPVFIKNISKDTLGVGYGNYLPIILEAIDSKGEWKPIQFLYLFSCGTGLTYYFLPPNEIMISSCKIYEGPYLTRLRLRYGLKFFMYSQEFSGTIHPGQFNKPENVYW